MNPRGTTNRAHPFLIRRCLAFYHPMGPALFRQTRKGARVADLASSALLGRRAGADRVEGSIYRCSSSSLTRSTLRRRLCPEHRSVRTQRATPHPSFLYPRRPALRGNKNKAPVENLSLSLNAAPAVLAAHPLRDVHVSTGKSQCSTIPQKAGGRLRGASSCQDQPAPAVALAPTVVPAAALAA
jgi:hypothetical protein